MEVFTRDAGFFLGLFCICEMYSSAVLLSLALARGLTASLAYKGVDWSSFNVEETAGYTYKTTAGVTQPLETILKASGVNTVRCVCLILPLPCALPVSFM